MADSVTITSNVIGANVSGATGASVSVTSNVAESSSVSASVTTGGVGPQGPDGATGADGVVQSIVAGTNVTVDSTDAANPIVNVSGGGAVDSVNTQTGVVVLDQDDVADGTTYKQYSATEKTKLSGIATAATANSSDATLKARANHTGTQSADTITDGTTNKAFLATERTKLTGIATAATANDTDANLKNRANHTGTQSADTLTDGTTNKAFLATERTKLSGIPPSATANDTDANLKARANHTGTQTASTISDFTTATNALLTESNLNHSLPYKTSGLDNWFTALGTASTTPLNVVIIGDSISVTTAFGVTKPWGQRIVDRFTNNGRTPIPEASWRFAYSTQVLGMTTNQGALHSPVMGMGGVATDLTNGQKATMVATMDGISVVYSKQSGGGDLEVRDGAGGTLLTTISTAGTAKSSFIWTSSALTRASHTIEITSVGNTILEGVYVHDGTRAAGVRVWTASKSGYTSNDFATIPSLALDLLDNLNPDLVIIATGTNDSAANYATYMAALIAAVQAHSNCDIALWFPYGSTSGFNSTEEAAGRAYIESAPFIALNIPVIDAGLGTPNISTRYSPDGIHPNDTGAEYIAQHIYSVVGGDPLGQIINYGVTNKISAESLETLKAPKASPTFTGTAVLDNATFSGANGVIGNFFTYPYVSLKETGNTNVQVNIGTAALNNALNGFNAPGFNLGSGSGAGDTNLYRSAANVLKTDDSFVVGADLILTTRTPASATAAGTAGTVCWDSSYIYVCTATNQWKRVAIATW